MSYRFMNYRRVAKSDGVEPDCPDGVECVRLADLPGLEWGICDVQDRDAGPPGAPVSDEIAGLIESAMRYPPALALAREEVGLVFSEHRPNQVEFARAYGMALRSLLSKQHEAPYILARAMVGEAGRLAEGEWYWMLKISGTPTVVSWVSADFNIFENDTNDFDFTGQQRKHLGYIG